MSLTNSSDGLALLSTFHHHIPIHDHSPVKTMVALASLALQSAKKLFQNGSLENKSVILTLSGAVVLIPTHIGDFTDFDSALGSDGGSLWRLICSLMHPETQHCLALTLYISSSYSKCSVMEADRVTQGCVYRAASLMGGTFPETARSERLLMILLDYKKMSGWVFNIIDWLFSLHTLRPHDCVQTLYKSDFYIIGPFNQIQVFEKLLQYKIAIFFVNIC